MINSHQRQYKERLEQGVIIKRPEWLKVRLASGQNFTDVKSLMTKQKLNTVCEEARCPNLSECWNRRTATFMILGDTCTRSCGFCNIKLGIPQILDTDEPRRVAESVQTLGLKHAVITSVNRDELEDGGASMFAETVKLIREYAPECTIEILIPDFKGYIPAFETILNYPPDILNHNLETVRRMYHVVRPQAKYERSLELLDYFHNAGLLTKSGIMVGIGETNEEVVDLMSDLRGVHCQILTIGQYLQPTKGHLPVARFVTPEEFQYFKERGLDIGFAAVESAPLVRSSYHADKQVDLIIPSH